MREDTGRAPEVAWRFGDYQLRIGQRQLLRGGVPVDVEDRALDLVILLVGERHRAVDRREIIETLWGRRPVTDAALRQLVYKARRAVGDDGGAQAVIRTSRGRSLQWVAPLEPVEPNARPAAPLWMAQPVAAAVGVQDHPSRPEEGPPARAPATRSGSRRRRPWIGLAVLGVLTLAVLAMPRGEAPPAPALPRLAVEPFANDTGDAGMDWIRSGLPGLLGSLVGQGGGLDVVDAQQVTQVWAYAPRPGRGRAQQLRYVTGADVLVAGRLRALARNLYELRLRVLPATGDEADLVLTGAQPGLLAAQASARIREVLRLAPQTPDTAALLHDRFLDEALARGYALNAEGQPGKAIDYLRLCVHGAPGSLPIRLELAIAQANANDLTAARKTLGTLLAMARARGDERMIGRALLRKGRWLRDVSNESDALGVLRDALPHAQAAHDTETEVGIHLLIAITAHTLAQRRLAAAEMAAARALLAGHPELRHQQGTLDDAEDLLALEDGDPRTALDAARRGLALREAEGDERSVVVSLNNIAVALRALHRDAESLAVIARAYQRAVAGHYTELQFDAGGNLALGLLTTGQPRRAAALVDRLLPVTRQMGSPPLEVMALQIRALAQLQMDRPADALASLHEGDRGAGDPAALRFDIFLNQCLYEAIAAFGADKGALPAIGRALDVAARGRRHAGGTEVPDGYARRQLQVRALIAAADGDARDATALLSQAAAAPPVDGDGDVENRMVPLLVAMAGGDDAAATLALKGYAIDNASDATLLHVYRQWAASRNDRTTLARIDRRLAHLRAMSVDAVRVLDAGMPVATAP